jgi:hypothetical protein
MKNYWLAALLSISLLGCGNYVQLITLSDSNGSMKEAESFFTFENDSVRVTYNFWAEKGIMSFVVFNKLAVPIYIDWKKSSFIEDGGIKLDYYSEKEVRTSNTYYETYNFKVPFRNFITSESQGFAETYQVSNKEERITFIPPNSKFQKADYIILPNKFYSKEGSVEKTVPLSINNKKTTKIYELNIPREKATFKVRNFITYSTTESFKNEHYVDHGFYISEIVTMNKIHFEGEQIFIKNNAYPSYPFKDPKKFFIYQYPVNNN